MFLRLEIWNLKKVINWDVTIYYSYLPATFIYHDYTFDDADTLWYKAHFQQKLMDDGVHTYPAKMTFGTSLFYAPFFLAAHSYAKTSSDYEPNGFSIPYEIALLLSSLIFGLIGLWFFGNWLHNYVSSAIAAAVTVSIFIGTNLAYYTFVEPMSHVYGFALASAILYYFDKYLITQKTYYSAILGILTGTLILIRPTNIVILLFLFVMLFLKRRKLDLKKLAKQLFIAIPLAALIWIPQFLYWYHMTSQWLFYSYNDESFFFTDPEIWKGLFSYRKGWFLYSPLLLLAIPGFWLMFKKHTSVAIGSLTVLFAGLWVTFSWWCWWYGGGLGARAMIEYLPFMGLALALLFEFVKQKKLIVSIPVFVIASFLCIVSLRFTQLYIQLYFHPDSMSKEIYWKQPFSKKLIKNYFKLLVPPDYEKAKRNEDG